jgi:stage II sporulation protein B
VFLAEKGGRQMDKQTSNTIKIKINGTESAKAQSEETIEEIPFASQDEKLEAEKEVASAKQRLDKEDEFPWLLPDVGEDEVFLDDPKVVTPVKEKKTLSNQTVTSYLYPNKNKSNFRKKIVQMPLKRVLMILFMAVGLGLLFGYVALNFLSNEDMPAAGTSTNNGTNDGIPTSESSDKGNESDKGAEEQAPTTGTMSTATLQLYAVQGGIFSGKESAETVASEIKNQGFASTVIEKDGKYIVFAGLGKEKAETDGLNELYKQGNFSEFWGGKQLSLTIATSSSSEQWASSIEELSSFASQVASGNTVTQEDVSKIESIVNEINASNGEKELVEKLLQSTEYIKNNNGWKAQQLLLDVMSKLSA